MCICELVLCAFYCIFTATLSVVVVAIVDTTVPHIRHVELDSGETQQTQFTLSKF